MNRDENKFRKLDKEDWLALIRKSLKGADLSDYKWEPETNLQGLSFGHKDDLDEVATPTVKTKQGNAWNVGLYLTKPISYEPWMNTDSLKLHFDDFSHYISELRPNFSYGSVSIIVDDPVQLANLDEVNQLSDVNIVLRSLEDFNASQILQHLTKINSLIIGIDKVSGPTSSSASDQISIFFRNLVKWLEQLEDRDLLKQLIGKIGFTYPVASANLLYEAALMRAFKIVWYNIQMAMLDEVTDSNFDVDVDVSSFSGDENHQLILGTVAAIGALVSGVGNLYINSDSDQNDPGNHLRLLRNIQLILKKEASMDLVSDPLAGSYALEDLTRKIALSVWNQII